MDYDPQKAEFVDAHKPFCYNPIITPLNIYTVDGMSYRIEGHDDALDAL
jgi:hypothetical protein